MAETLTLSRSALAAFLICQRRFQLRYLNRLAWPEAPLPEAMARLQARGQAFHQLLERHFLGLPVVADEIEDGELRQWWLAFQRSGLSLPHGRYLTELSLTVPVGQHLLIGRFDLLIMGKEGETGTPFAHLFDWKTGRPRPAADLRQDWQTRLYLGMLAESEGALWAGGTPNPDAIAITYWYVRDPARPRTIRYSQAQHAQNWAEIKGIVAQIEEQLAADENGRNVWPLTDDWTACGHCTYQVYCGRQGAGLAAAVVVDDEDEGDGERVLPLEPEIP